MYVAMLPLWRRALIKLKQLTVKKNFSRLAVGAAFVFVLQMFNLPIPGGTTGHAVGGAVVALVFGPWPALTIVSLVLLIQAFVFGDGGLTAFGANSFAMAFVQPFAAALVYQLVTRSSLFTKDNATNFNGRQM
jgi:cobalt/nickel transport system permease protein